MSIFHYFIFILTQVCFLAPLIEDTCPTCHTVVQSLEPCCWENTILITHLPLCLWSNYIFGDSLKYGLFDLLNR